MRTRLRVLAATAASALLLSACGFHGLYSANLPGGPGLGSHPYDVYIQFSNVLDLVPQSDVKVNDVPVGKVLSVSLVTAADGQWVAKVKIEVNGDISLPANALANVQQTSLLGEKYVELSQPPSPSAARLVNNDLILLSNTGSAPDVEEVLGALALLLNEGGLQQIQTISTELNNALNGHEAAVHDLLSQLNGFVKDLDDQKDKITNALVAIDSLVTTLNQQKQSLTEALDTFPQALKILADDEPQFTTLLQSLSNLGSVATQVITSTNTELTTALQTLNPVLSSLIGAGDNLPNALKFLLTFPFPVGKATQAVKGDYANLGLHLDLSLNQELCGLNVPGLNALINLLVTQPSQKCTGTSPTPPKTTPKKSTASTIAAGGVATQSALVEPFDIASLPGMGG